MTLVSAEDPSREIHLTGHLARKYEWVATELGEELTPIQDALNDTIDRDRIHTSSWIPGKYWTGTPYQAIHEVCHHDDDEAAKCFGLIFWKVFEHRPESWMSGHGMKDGREIRGRTYYLPNLSSITQYSPQVVIESSLPPV